MKEMLKNIRIKNTEKKENSLSVNVDAHLVLLCRTLYLHEPTQHGPEKPVREGTYYLME